MAIVTITWELPVGTAKALAALYGKRKAKKGERTCRARKSKNS